MTGAEHYQEAERLLTELHLLPADKAMVAAASAQIHATLAVAAATRAAAKTPR